PAASRFTRSLPLGTFLGARLDAARRPRQRDGAEAIPGPVGRRDLLFGLRLPALCRAAACIRPDDTTVRRRWYFARRNQQRRPEGARQLAGKLQGRRFPVSAPCERGPERLPRLSGV